MKEYLRFVFTTLMFTMILFLMTVFGIIMFPQGTFHSSYQSVIQDKYRILVETNEPKIIIVSGSSSSFGLDQKMLEEATGYKVANLGLHAGFGHLFYSELAKANINEGDIVLLGYEYGWESDMDSLNQQLIMTGIDDNIEMYTKLPIRKWPKFIGYLFQYAGLKNSYKDAHGIYSREAFDSETGQMTMERNEIMEYSEELYGSVDISGVTISQEVIDYLCEYKEYVEECGAKIYFIAPPILADCIKCEYSEFDNLKDLEEEEIGIPYISNPTDYIFPREWMFNANYHCNSVGEKRRTELLIADLYKYGIIENN